jgi:hypothetical protein
MHNTQNLPFVASDSNALVREMWTRGYRSGQRDAQKEQKERESYNGWTNYATWVVNLWIDNDEGAQEHWRERAEDLLKDELADGNSADDAREEAARNLADEMREEFEQGAEDATGVSGALSDLLSHALGLVEWQEISEHYVSDIELYAAGWNMPGYMPDSEPAFFTDDESARQYILDELERMADEAETEGDAENFTAMAEDINLVRHTFTAGPVAGYVYWVNRV